MTRLWRILVIEWKKIQLKDRLQTRISILGLIISLFGFVAVILSLHASDKTANNDTYLKTYAWTIDIDKALVESPNLIRYLKKKWETTKDSTLDEAKAKAFAEYMLDIYDAVLNNKSYFDNDPHTERQWIETIAQQFDDYPVLCDVFDAKCSLYGPRLNDAYVMHTIKVESFRWGINQFELTRQNFDYIPQK